MDPVKNSTSNSKRTQSTLEKFAFGALTLAAASVASPALGDVNFDFNSSNGSFTSSFNTASFDGPWTYNSGSGVGGSGGWSTIGQSANNNRSNTTDLTSSLMTVIATGSVGLTFDHRYSFEVDSGGSWDGGAVFVSRNGGAYTMVGDSAFTANGYNGALTGWSAGSQLAGSSPVFSGTSASYSTSSYVTSVADLGSFNSGDTFSVRFRAAFDSNTSAGTPSWSVDNIVLKNTVPTPGAMALLAVAGTLASRRRRCL